MRVPFYTQGTEVKLFARDHTTQFGPSVATLAEVQKKSKELWIAVQL